MAGEKNESSEQEIDLEKGTEKSTEIERVKTEKNRYTKQQFKMQEIFMELAAEQFDKEITYNDLRNYIELYERILYSTISHLVYDVLETSETDRKAGDPFATLLSNLDALRIYTDSVKDQGGAKERKITADTKKAVWKLWDHINLAHRQFRELRISEDEYKRRFEQQIDRVQANITKETNSQMLTIVGIFTAVAFVVFGGISSLGSILSGIQENNLLKLLIVACIWGIGMLNVVFVFLYGIGKLTGKEIKTTESTKLRDKYPLYFWTNYLLLVIIIMLCWLYFCHNRQSFSWMDWFIRIHPEIVGFSVFFLGVCFFAWYAVRLKTGKWRWWK